MSTDDPWRDESRDDPQRGSDDQRERFGFEETFSPDGEPPRRGMSTGMKVFIALLAMGGLCMLLCCGGFFYLASQFEFNNDAVAGRNMTAEIAEIEVPPGFEPAGSMRMNMLVFKMKASIYESESEGSALMLAEMSVPFAKGEQPAVDMQDALKQRDQNRQDLTITSTESREFEIRGKKVDFVFAEAEDENGNAFRQVTGTFPGKGDSTGFLLLQLPEEEYDEEAAVKMIESIK